MTASLTIIRAKEFVVIAADSCASDALDRQTGKQCKIVQVGEYVYTANKFVHAPDSGYDLEHIIKDAGAPKSLDAWATGLKQCVYPALIHALSMQKQQNPNGFAATFKTRIALGITLVGIENGGPSLINLNFLIKDLGVSNVELEIEDHRCPGADCAAGVAMVLVGDEEFKVRFQQENPDYWVGDVDRIVKNAEHFVQKAIDENIPGVGLPISVLVISPSGFDWRKRGLCDTQSPTQHDN
ncbi:MAG: hypothetical protein WB680_13215 [Candidatus Acidiferrales bacterium]